MPFTFPGISPYLASFPGLPVQYFILHSHFLQVLGISPYLASFPGLTVQYETRFYFARVSLGTRLPPILYMTGVDILQYIKREIQVFVQCQSPCVRVCAAWCSVSRLTSCYPLPSERTDAAQAQAQDTKRGISFSRTAQIILHCLPLLPSCLSASCSTSSSQTLSTCRRDGHQLRVLFGYYSNRGWSYCSIFRTPMTNLPIMVFLFLTGPSQSTKSSQSSRITVYTRYAYTASYVSTWH